jgi:serine/threonine-protein kinase
VTAYNFTVISGTFNANNSTTYRSPTAPRSLRVTADRAMLTGIVDPREVQRAVRRPHEPGFQGQAPIPTTSTPTGTPVAP